MDFLMVLFWTHGFPLLAVVSLVAMGVVIGAVRWHKRRVRCEACGCAFQPEDGYYEPGEYAYCRDCCHW
ncbi:hypothetical protein KSF_054800 [Reticulibacter mediterranei]|uniref:Uncharacterized protein n=1 Tax=Reticulibacter mediterranei TaxID=2778369 RepID=A0A8J3N5S0_9CHLR|nr:hypothetical protein [Reticulibacter mediterranei]GHO95432.1 hypothetical protein KSF_054800 [Reticulibacter mediterranei]